VSPAAGRGLSRRSVQGYLAHKKPRPPGPYSRIMPKALRGGAVSYERGTPAPERILSAFSTSRRSRALTQEIIQLKINSIVNGFPALIRLSTGLINRCPITMNEKKLCFI